MSRAWHHGWPSTVLGRVIPSSPSSPWSLATWLGSRVRGPLAACPRNSQSISRGRFSIVLTIFALSFPFLSFPCVVCCSGLFDVDGLHNPERHRAKLPLPAGETGKSRSRCSVRNCFGKYQRTCVNIWCVDTVSRSIDGSLAVFFVCYFVYY